MYSVEKWVLLVFCDTHLLQDCKCGSASQLYCIAGNICGNKILRFAAKKDSLRI